MVRRSSLIFAASLAVFSTLESAYGLGGVGGILGEKSKNEVQKPRFMKKNVKRFYPNVTTSDLGHGRNPALGHVQIPGLDDKSSSSSSSSSSSLSSSTSSSSSSSSQSLSPSAEPEQPIPTPPSSTNLPPSSSSPPSSSPSPSSEPLSEKPNSQPTTANSLPGSPSSTGGSTPGDEEKAGDDDSSATKAGSSGPNNIPIPTTTKPQEQKDDVVLPSPSVSIGLGGGNDDDETDNSDTSNPSKPQPSSTKNTSTPESPENKDSTGSENGQTEQSGSSNKDQTATTKAGTENENQKPSSTGSVTSPQLPDKVDTSKQDTSEKVANGASSKASEIGSVVSPVVKAVGDDSDGKLQGTSASNVVVETTKQTPSPGNGESKEEEVVKSPQTTSKLETGDETPNDSVSEEDEKNEQQKPSAGLPSQLAGTNNIPASITSNGVVIPNPVVSGKGSNGLPIESDQQKPIVATTPPAPENSRAPEGNNGIITDSNGNTVSGGNIANEISPSTTLPNGSVIPNPAFTSPSQSGNKEGVEQPLPEGKSEVTLSNGDVVPIPTGSAGSADNSSTSNDTPFVPQQKDQSGSSPTPVIIPGSGSTTLPNGDVVPISVLPSQGGVVLPGSRSTTLPNGDVVPISASPSQGGQIVPGSGSTTLPNGDVVPISASPSQGGQIVPGSGSTTLPNGDVVPISASPSQGRPGEFFQKPNAQSVALPASGLSGPGTGIVAQVPSQETGASPSPPVVGGQAPGASVNTAAQPTITSPSGDQQKFRPGDQNAPGPTNGPVASEPQVYPSDAKVFSQKPIGYDQNTVLPVEPSITFEPSSAPPTTGTQSTPTGLPTDVPLVLYPPTGKAKQPANTILIQIGFLFPLNYEFVWKNDQSQRQIFAYLPIGIGNCLGIERLNVTMQTLRAWDTTADLHYITTLALVWIPSHLVDPLALAIRTPAGNFYNQPNPSVRTLLSMVNNAIPIRADNIDEAGTETGTSGGNPESTSGAAPIGGNIGKSSPVKASSVGIGVGVVCGAAAYGAAMFFVARRYKKRRQNHMRSPSMFSSPVMSHAGGDPAAGQALMSGAMGGERSVSPYYDRAESRGSARSGGSSGRQQISAPVMAENSLGWN